MNIVISWIGFNEDVKKAGDSLQFDPSGFTATIQKDIVDEYQIDKHVILFSKDTDKGKNSEVKKRKYLIRQLFETQYPDRVYEMVDTDIGKDDLQNFPVIEASLRSYLQSLEPSDSLFVIAGTGPTAVGMAWGTLNMAMVNRFGLYLLQRPEYTIEGKKSTLIKVEPFISQLLDEKLREFHLSELPQDIYRDTQIEKEYKKAMAIAKAPKINVLILGETGCGKDKMAEFIVKHSPLSSENYRAINCASLPDELLYSELFGHVEGAFTGATKGRQGLFEVCNNGTLFLDEIGDISPFMQQSLLRAIENGEIKKLGEDKIQKAVHVRIIAATNVDLYEKCKVGKFRWDLYYRLSKMEIELQPYRNRSGKGRLKVIEHYVALAEKDYNKKLHFTKEVKTILDNYSFPGNFREISNTFQGLFGMGESEISADMLPRRFRDIDALLDEKIETVKKKHCIAIYRKYNYDLAASKKALGYSNSTQLKKSLIAWGVYVSN
ncbi:MAG: sigma-54 factor interaction domain-containing protein [Flavobacterium sp.]|nr:MAG: sigma-54 factor interaction domain-containing protein [Flavobacterium sp.]